MAKKHREESKLENEISSKELKKLDKKSKKMKKDKKDKKDKKNKKEKQERAESEDQRSGSGFESNDGEFVAQKGENKMNLKELLFGQRKRIKSGVSDDEATTNYLTG